MSEFTGEIHPAAGLFEMLAPDELQELADDIQSHGLHEELVLNETGALLDGRNRLAACKVAGIEPRFRIQATDDPIAFVLSENVRRRHLTEGQKAVLGLQIKKLEAQLQTDKGGRPTTQKPSADLREVSDPPKANDRKSSAKAAKKVRTSARNIEKADKLERDAPDLLEKVKQGMPIDRAARIQRDREAEARRIEEARQHASTQPEPPRIDLRLGDFREVLADVTDLDAIITDPPYPREYLPLLADLAAFSDKALKPDGVLVILMGQTHLPEVYRLLDGHRPYRWTGCYLTPGAGYPAQHARAQSNWKPIIIYGGGPRFADVIRSEGTDAGAKDLHHWGQDYGAFHTIVERFTAPRATVCDPFAGSGTTLLAAKALGRHAVGAELDPEHHAAAARRLA